MLVSRTLITRVPLISAGCVGFHRCVSRICENLRQICVPVRQVIPRFTNNVFVLPFFVSPRHNQDSFQHTLWYNPLLPSWDVVSSGQTAM